MREGGRAAIASWRAVEGLISVSTLSVEDQIAQGQEMAKEMKMPFDPKSVKGPKVSIQIKGEGAEIQ